MTITVLTNVVIPQGILTAGITGELSRQNKRGQNIGGFATVNAYRDVTMRSYQVGTGPMRQDAGEKLVGAFEVTDAGTFGMLYEDPIDSSVTVANGALQGYMLGVEYGNPGFGNGGPVYGFRKMYAVWGGALSRARAFTRLNGTPSLYRGGTPVTIGVAAGNAAISAGPSYVTFVADASQSVTAVTVGATTQVTLSAALAGLVVGGRLWLQDLTGTHASLLNSMSHEITAITGGSLNVYTLATNTAGKTITPAGTGKKYPQTDEALTVAARFYVPVHFRNDTLAWELVIAGPTAKREIVVASCFLDEIREA
ncbi:hypothetical protein QTI05_22775 [Variovorax sp. J22R193]|uniref:hypothetical protein n=1 Tax=Variovorax fucosicus TaxID=3053517 RepID=UPI002577B812|nr:hypothetical protein [Variovorax sp. J22R193]MDM0041883.1 hypothetical protein [Variovorax sp. J22R193]